MTHHNTDPNITTLTSPEGDGNIDTRHLDEWTNGSGIDPELACLNLESISGEEAFDRLYPNPDRTNTGRLAAKDLYRYQKFEGKRGWWGSTLDPETWERSEWGCFKPDTEVFRDTRKGKPIKYLHPSGTATQPYFLRIPEAIGRKISERYGLGGGTENWPELLGAVPTLDITEGAKKTASLISCGMLAVGLSGIWNGCPKVDGKHQLHPDLKKAIRRGLVIRLWFDQDARPITRKNVDHAISVLANLIRMETGTDPLIAEWDNQLGKGIDDVLTGYGEAKIDDIADSALPFTRWAAKGLKRLVSEPSVILDQRYLEFSPPTDSNLIALKSPKGTGKTEWLANFCRPRHLSGSHKTLLITHRIQLGSQTAGRIGIPQMGSDDNAKADMSLGVALCWDSLWKLNPEDWLGADIILDEINQSLDHLLNASTDVRRQRAKILDLFGQMVAACLSGGGKIIIADADLRESSLDVIRAIWPGDITRREYIIDNHWKPIGMEWEIVSYGGKTPAQILRSLELEIEAGNKPFICCSSQKHKSKWGTINLEKRLSDKYPHLKILRIDSSTVADPEHPAFGCMAILNEVVGMYDIVIASPTIETGVSITVEHFDSVWGIFQGVQGADSTRQFLSRIRASIPRHIWLAPQGLEQRGNGANSIKGLIGGEKRKSNGVDKALLSAGITVTDSDEISVNSCWLKCWAIHAAIINSEKPYYESQVTEDLKAEGHRVFSPEDYLSREKLSDILSSEDEVKETQTNIRDESHSQWCKAVAQADDIDDDIWFEFSKKANKNEREQLRYKKGVIARKYARIPVTPGIVAKDEKGWYSKIKLHYFWGDGREFLRERDKSKAEIERKNNDNLMFLPDRNRQTWGNKIAVLDYLKFGELLSLPEISNEHPLAIEVWGKIKKHHWEISLNLSSTLATRTPMDSITHLMQLVGLRYPKLRQERREGDKRIRIYGQPAADFVRGSGGRVALGADGKPVPMSDGRESVFVAWVKEDLAKREERAEMEAQEREAVKLATEQAAQLAREMEERRRQDEAMGRYWKTKPPVLGERVVVAGVEGVVLEISDETDNPYWFRVWFARDKAGPVIAKMGVDDPDKQLTEKQYVCWVRLDDLERRPIIQKTDVEVLETAFECRTHLTVLSVFNRMKDKFYELLGQVRDDISEWCWVVLSEAEGASI